MLHLPSPSILLDHTPHAARREALTQLPDPKRCSLVKMDCLHPGHIEEAARQIKAQYAPVHILVSAGHGGVWKAEAVCGCAAVCHRLQLLLS